MSNVHKLFKDILKPISEFGLPAEEKRDVEPMCLSECRQCGDWHRKRVADTVFLCPDCAKSVDNRFAPTDPDGPKSA